MNVNPALLAEYTSLPYYYFADIPKNFTGKCVCKNGLGAEYISTFLNGKKHSVNTPAETSLDGWSYKCWYVEGKMHRLDGPAKLYYSGFGPPTSSARDKRIKIEIYSIDDEWLSEKHFKAHPKVVNYMINKILEL